MSGQKLVREAEQTVNLVELQASTALSTGERRMLIGLWKFCVWSTPLD